MAEQLRGLSNSGLSPIHASRTEYRSCATHSTKADWTGVSCVACVKYAVTGRISKVTQGRSRRQWASSALRQEIPGNDLRMQRCVTPKPMLKQAPRDGSETFSLILILIDNETADASPSEA